MGGFVVADGFEEAGWELVRGAMKWKAWSHRVRIWWMCDEM